MSTKAPVDGREREDVAADAAHPIGIGTTVTVFKIAQAHGPFIEGRAVTKGRARGRNRYLVQFMNDPRVRLRVVHAACQIDPERMLEILLDIWRASNEAAVDEFYPDESN